MMQPNAAEEAHMISEVIHEEVLRTLVQQNVARECLVAKIDGG
jgi:hypothetical protein